MVIKKKEQKFFQAKYKSTAITVPAAAVVKAWPPPPHQHFRRLQKWLVLCSTVEQNVTCFMWNGLFFSPCSAVLWPHRSKECAGQLFPVDVDNNILRTERERHRESVSPGRTRHCTEANVYFIFSVRVRSFVGVFVCVLCLHTFINYTPAVTCRSNTALHVGIAIKITHAIVSR